MAGATLVACLVVAVGAVSFGIAGAASVPVIDGGAGVAIATFLVVMTIGLLGLIAFALHERRARRS